MAPTAKMIGGNAISEADPLPVAAEATASAAVTPDDDDDLDPIPRGVHCSVAGDVVGFLEDDDVGGTARTFAVLAGMYYPYRFRRITTATDATVVALS